MPALALLRALIEREGIEVTHSYCDRDDERGGAFFPYGLRGATAPTIQLLRPRSEQGKDRLEWTPNAAQAQEALFTLAHEYGHYLSFRADQARYEAFFLAYSKLKYILQAKRLQVPTTEALSPDELRLIEEEEQRAWELGRDHVPVHLIDAYTAHGLQRVDWCRRGTRGLQGRAS